jgi:hypothetical protein
MKVRDDLHSEIVKVAYELHERRGWKHGQDVQDWLEAERIVLTRYEKGSEKVKSKKSSKASTTKKK